MDPVVAIMLDRLDCVQSFGSSSLFAYCPLCPLGILTIDPSCWSKVRCTDGCTPAALLFRLDELEDREESV